MAIQLLPFLTLIVFVQLFRMLWRLIPKFKRNASKDASCEISNGDAQQTSDLVKLKSKETKETLKFDEKRGSLYVRNIMTNNGRLVRVSNDGNVTRIEDVYLDNGVQKTDIVDETKLPLDSIVDRYI